MSTNHDPSPSVDARTLVQDCLTTYRLCLDAAVRRRSEPQHNEQLLNVLDDCAEIHLAMANFLLRESQFQYDLATLCAAVARAAADELQPIEHEEAELRAVYAACLRTHHGCAAWMGAESLAAPDARDLVLDESFPASDPPPPPTEL